MFFSWSNLTLPFIFIFHIFNYWIFRQIFLFVTIESQKFFIFDKLDLIIFILKIMHELWISIDIIFKKNVKLKKYEYTCTYTNIIF